MVQFSRIGPPPGSFHLFATWLKAPSAPNLVG